MYCNHEQGLDVLKPKTEKARLVLRLSDKRGVTSRSRKLELESLARGSMRDRAGSCAVPARKEFILTANTVLYRKGSVLF